MVDRARFAILACCVFGVLCAPSAGAQVAAGVSDSKLGRGAAWKERPLALELHAGIGMPLGFLGVAADYSPFPELGVGAGLGIGAGAEIGSGLRAPGPRGALLAHFRPAYGVRNAFVFDAGYSVGGYRRPQLAIGLDGSPPRSRSSADVAHWLQLGAGWERRAENGFVLRTVAGFAKLLNPGDLACFVRRDGEPWTQCTGDEEDHDKTLLYMEVTLGIAP